MATACVYVLVNKSPHMILLWVKLCRQLEFLPSQGSSCWTGHKRRRLVQGMAHVPPNGIRIELTNNFNKDFL